MVEDRDRWVRCPLLSRLFSPPHGNFAFARLQLYEVGWFSVVKGCFVSYFFSTLCRSIGVGSVGCIANVYVSFFLDNLRQKIPHFVRGWYLQHETSMSFSSFTLQSPIDSLNFISNVLRLP
jgi:hypothetical protein